MDIQLRNAKHATLITPSDSADLTRTANKGLYIGGTGAVSVVTLGGETVTFPGVAVGFFPIAVKRVRATGTTATNIIALA